MSQSATGQLMGLTATSAGQCVSTPATVLKRSSSNSSMVDGEYFLVKKGPRGLIVDAKSIPTEDSKGPSQTKNDSQSIVAASGTVTVPVASSAESFRASGAVYSTPVDLKMPALLRAPPRLRQTLAKGKSIKHQKHGRLDVYPTVLSVPSGATSDASGNLPGYFNVAQIVNTGGWSSFGTDFDMVRVKKLVIRFQPKLGYKTSRSYTPLTSTACQMLRVWSDPDGALASPTVANAVAVVPGSQAGLSSVADHPLIESFTHTYVPTKPIVRFGAAALTYTNLHDWMDTNDVASFGSNSLIGGIVWNVVQAGACPASTDIFSTLLEFHVEFALRA